MTQLPLNLDLPIFTSHITPGDVAPKEIQEAVRKRIRRTDGLQKQAWERLVADVGFDWETGVSGVWTIPQDILSNSFGNGNKLFRNSSVVAQNFIIRFIYANGIERVTQLGGAVHYKHGKKTEDGGDTTVAIRIEGYRPISTQKRGVPKSIRDRLEKKGELYCVVNGSSTNLNIDHKQGRDYDGIWLDGDDLDLYQPLTQHNNMVKKSACEKCVISNKRFEATKLGFCVNVLEGTENFDSAIGCNGCYWHDVKRFHKEHYTKKDTTS